MEHKFIFSQMNLDIITLCSRPKYNDTIQESKRKLIFKEQRDNDIQESKGIILFKNTKKYRRIGITKTTKDNIRENKKHNNFQSCEQKLE